MHKTSNKRKLIPRSAVIEYWYKNMPNFSPYIDIGEPICWACGKPVSIRFDNKNPDATEEECFKIWDKVGHLQVCHIIPKSLGGSDALSNLFLMCKECHELAPDTSYPDIFFKWVEQQNYVIREADQLLKELKVFNLNIEDLKFYSTSQIANTEEFQKFLFANSGIHRTIYGGTKIKKSTTAGLLYKFIQLKKELNE